MKKIFLITLTILCFSLAFSQNKKPDQRVIDKSCDCINNLDPNIPVKQKNDSINSCILSSNIFIQTLDNLTGKSKKTAIKEGSKDSTSVIYAEKDLDLIQEVLLKDCPRLREFLMTDNEKLENSVTKNKEALAFHSKGSVFFNQEKYELAIKEFKRAVEIDPKFAFAWDDLGLSYRKLNKLDEAIKCYKKSLELDPKSRTPLMNMAVAYQLKNDKKEAIDIYKKYIEFYPEDPEGFYGIARVYREIKDYENSLESAIKAVDLYEKSKSPYIQDAINVIREVVRDLKEEKKIYIFNKFAEKYGIEKIKD